MPTSNLHLTISGRSASQRMQTVLPEGETVRIGRAPKRGWSIPWDETISREHADVSWNGTYLRIDCVEAARNPVVYQGRKSRAVRLLPNEWIQIGQTTIQASSVVAEAAAPAHKPQEIELDTDSEDVLSERAYTHEQLQKVPFRNTEKQMEILARLPEMISTSHSDDDLGTMLSELLLAAIPMAVAIAVAHFDDSKLPADISKIDKFPAPLTMRVRTRDDFEGSFKPSRRMLFQCLSKQTSVMHIFGDMSDAQFTVNDGLSWAFCAPIKSESSVGWCLYVSGSSSQGESLVVSESDLVGDLRFTQLLAQFIGSVRQVRMLQEQKT